MTQTWKLFSRCRLFLVSSCYIIRNEDCMPSQSPLPHLLRLWVSKYKTWCSCTSSRNNFQDLCRVTYKNAMIIFYTSKEARSRATTATGTKVPHLICHIYEFHRIKLSPTCISYLLTKDTISRTLVISRTHYFHPDICGFYGGHVALCFISLAWRQKGLTSYCFKYIGRPFCFRTDDMICKKLPLLFTVSHKVKSIMPSSVYCFTQGNQHNALFCLQFYTR